MDLRYARHKHASHNDLEFRTHLESRNNINWKYHNERICDQVHDSERLPKRCLVGTR